MSEVISYNWNNIDVEFIPYPDKKNTGGRVWIGQIQIADVYQRESGGDLFEELKIQYEFLIRQFKKYQPQGEWLKLDDRDKSSILVDTIGEGLQWIIEKLND